MGLDINIGELESKDEARGNWIKLHRSISDWEWFTDPGALVLFVTLLTGANYKTSKWRGHEIKRGQILTGRKFLSIKTGLCESKITRLLEKFKMTGEIVIETNNKFSLITICNFDKYQTLGATNRTTDEQQSNNNRTTIEQPSNTSKKDNKSKKDKNEDIPEVANAISAQSKPKKVKPVFNPEGKTKYREYVYLDAAQLERCKEFYKSKDLEKADLSEAIDILNDWFANKPDMRAKRLDDARSLCGWCYTEVVKRKTAHLKLMQQENFMNERSFRK